MERTVPLCTLALLPCLTWHSSQPPEGGGVETKEKLFTLVSIYTLRYVLRFLSLANVQ
jgi:hypothetical protein